LCPIVFGGGKQGRNYLVTVHWRPEYPFSSVILSERNRACEERESKDPCVLEKCRTGPGRSLPRSFSSDSSLKRLPEIAGSEGANARSFHSDALLYGASSVRMTGVEGCG
jgi:hypothetical protein